MARSADLEGDLGYIALISDVFLRLIKMIIAPLVFSTLVVGIAHMATPLGGPRRRQGDALVRGCLALFAALGW